MKCKNNIFIILIVTIVFLTVLHSNGNAESFYLVFFQPSEITIKYSDEQLQREFEFMKEMGIKGILIQWTARGEKAYYPSKMFIPYAPTLVESILKLGEEYQIGVYLGVYFAEDWFKIVGKPSDYYAKVRAIVQVSIKELSELYSHYKALKGWYIPYEFSVASLRNEPLIRFISEISNDIKRITNGGTIIISPWIEKTIWSSDEVLRWESFLSNTGIDIVAIQDGAGAHEIKTEVFIDYLKNLVPLFKEKKRILWSVVEVFDKNFISASPERVIRQVSLEKPFVDGIVFFDFSHYLNPDRNEKAATLYRELKDYLNKNE